MAICSILECAQKSLDKCKQLYLRVMQITVSAPSGAVLGHVRTSGRAYSPSGWLDVFDADNKLLYSIQGQW